MLIQITLVVDRIITKVILISVNRENTPIERAVSYFKSQVALAQACGVTQASVSKWVNGGNIKPESAKKIEAATGGRVKRWELSDIFDKPEAA